MKVIFYTNHCPCCEVLKAKLVEADISFEIMSDTDAMLKMGITHLPMLSFEGNMMNYPAALAWLKERKTSYAD